MRTGSPTRMRLSSVSLMLATTHWSRASVRDRRGWLGWTTWPTSTVRLVTQPSAGARTTVRARFTSAVRTASRASAAWASAASSWRRRCSTTACPARAFSTEARDWAIWPERTPMSARAAVISGSVLCLHASRRAVASASASRADWTWERAASTCARRFAIHSAFSWPRRTRVSRACGRVGSAARTAARATSTPAEVCWSWAASAAWAARTWAWAAANGARDLGAHGGQVPGHLGVIGLDEAPVGPPVGVPSGGDEDEEQQEEPPPPLPQPGPPSKGAPSPSGGWALHGPLPSASRRRGVGCVHGGHLGEGEGLAQDLVHRLHRDEPQPLADAPGDLLEVLLVPPGEDDGRHQLLPDPAHGQDLAPERHLARHGHAPPGREARRRRGDRRGDGHARRGAVLRDRPARHVDVEVVPVEHLGRDPERVRPGAHVGEGGAGGLLHHFAQVPREDQTPPSPHEGRLDEEHLPSRGGPREPRDDADLVALPQDLREDLGRAEVLRDVLGADHDHAPLPLGHAAGGLPADGGDLALEPPHAGLPRVLADHPARAPPVGGGHCGLLGRGVGGELGCLGAVQEGRGDAHPDVGGTDEEDPR